MKRGSHVKAYASAREAALAVQKYERLGELGKGLFDTQRPLGVVRGNRTLVEYELLPEGQPLARAVPDRLRREGMSSAGRLLGSVGAALATIHGNLELDTRSVDSCSSLLERELGPHELDAHGQDRRVFLHGDFGFSNVGVRPSGVLVIIDAEPTHYTVGDIDAYCYPEFDVATMVSCLAGRSRRPSDALTLAVRTLPLTSHFLRGYQDCAGETLKLRRSRLAALVAAQGRAYARSAKTLNGMAASRLSSRAARVLLESRTVEPLPRS